MTADEPRAPGGIYAAAPGLVLPIFAATIFLSAALLFAVQPLFAKMVLPKFGGAPSVWSVAMVFFQAMLLAGYAYAHLLTRYLPPRLAAVLHVGVMLIAVLALPLGIAAGWGRPPTNGEAFWLLGLFAASIGLPFFALSANGPLLQAWFARTDHPAAGEPYFLYAASNVGSFLALVSYPFAVEPLTSLGEQTRVWSLGFYVLIALIAACGFALRHGGRMASAAGLPGSDSAPPTWRQAASWVALAAIPSGLLVAVTAHLSTDVAASPFLWVIPLALYLLTFVVVFQTRPILPHDWMVKLEPLAIVLLVGTLVMNVLYYIFITMAVNLVAFFIIALVCHGELARRRPAPRHLTAFYMWMATGGMIGGISAALIAPQVFSTVAEYPLLIVLAILCRPGLSLPRKTGAHLAWLAALAAAALILFLLATRRVEIEQDYFNYAIGGLLLVALLFWRAPLPFAAIVAFVFLVGRVYQTDEGRRESVRSFFGVVKVAETSDGMFRKMMSGTTEHGAQRIRSDDGAPLSGRPEPLTYYHRDSPMAQGIAAVRARRQGAIRMAVIGLGTGTLACYFAPGDTLDFYEIDPAVVRIATDPKRFSYLSSCAPEASIIVGDARLTLAEPGRGPYDIIVVDAFSSDAIPVHLLTREAMAGYLARLAPGGLILMHVSNRHMELGSVVAGIADANGLTTLINSGDKGEDDANFKYSSTVVAAARAEADFGALAESDDWSVEEANKDQRTWTDDYSNVIGAMIRKLRE